jgi:hypothetical protein
VAKEIRRPADQKLLPSWAVLGPCWTTLRAVLGPSWGHLGAISGNLRPSWAVSGEHIALSWAILGSSWPSSGYLGRSWGQLGYLGVPSWCMWRKSHRFWGSRPVSEGSSMRFGGSCGPGSKTTRAPHGSEHPGVRANRQQNRRLRIRGYVGQCTNGYTGLIVEDSTLSFTAWWPLTRRGRRICIHIYIYRCKYITNICLHTCISIGWATCNRVVYMGFLYIELR